MQAIPSSDVIPALATFGGLSCALLSFVARRSKTLPGPVQLVRRGLCYMQATGSVLIEMGPEAVGVFVEKFPAHLRAVRERW